MKLKFFFVAAILLITSGCATQQFRALPDQTKEIENPELSRIYVVRPTFFGASIPMKVYQDENLIGSTGPYGYLSWETEPKSVLLKGVAEDESTLLLDLKKSETYYIQQRVRWGFFIARNSLVYLSAEEGKKKLAKCNPPKIKSA